MLAVLAAVFVVLTVWILWGNKALECNTYTVTATRLPESFDGYRIAQVSDLHNAKMGKDNEKLLAMLREADPDMIAITGDLIDSRRTNVEIALMFIQEAVKIAPCYYVTGNHEVRVADAYAELKNGLTAAGVTVLKNTSAEITLGGESITLIGVNDPSSQTDYLSGDSEAVMDAALSGLFPEDEGFTLLLSHRPELFDLYAAYHIDLILTGHAHGGQFRLPLIGGIAAPNQGLFPEYDAGMYTEGNTHMVVSRGIGNSLFPFRVNNRPEVILIELRTN